MSTTENSSSGSVEPSNVLPLSALLAEEGTVPFCGMYASADAEYPDIVDTLGERYVGDEPQSFEEAIEVLPHAGEGQLWADNEFVRLDDDGITVDIDTEGIRDVHGLDVEKIERRVGASLDEIVSGVDAEELIQVSSHKDIIDRRRLALRTLGYDVGFRWQIASSRYTAGDIREFFRRKIIATRKHNAETAFGWIRHYDYGGSVSITTIYPSKAYEVGSPDSSEVELDGDEFRIAPRAGNESDSDVVANSDSTLTIYYGDRVGYDFRGRQKLWAKPVIFVPSMGVMIPLPDRATTLGRKHIGNMMKDAEGWHEKILSRIDNLCEEVNKDIMRARLVALDFDDLPFSIKEFYEYIGIRNEKYAEKAAKKAKRFASPSSRPTLWNLQLALKLAILENYEGTKAGDTYQEYQELSGELLRHPGTQIALAKEEHRILTQDSDKIVIDNDQQTLGESLADVINMSGVTENQLGASEAQQVQQRVQQRLPSQSD